MNPSVAAEAAFRANFAGRLEVGAGLCLWTGDGPVLSLADGWRERQQATPWARTTLAPVWSATKGPASAALLHALAAHGLDPDTPAGRVWPRLGPRLTLGQLMSHQAGLAALDREADASDPAAVATALEAQAPAWLPPDHGYHPRTFGFLVDELVRRITGAPNLGTYWHEAIARPHGIDFWIGLPPEVIIGCILRGERSIVPRGDTRILPGDVLILISADKQEISAIQKLTGRP